MKKQNWFKRLFAEAPAEVRQGPVLGTVSGTEGEALDLYMSQGNKTAENPNDFFDEEGKTLVEQTRAMDNSDPYLFGLMMTRKIAVTGLTRHVTGGDPAVLEFVQLAFSKIKSFSWILYQMLSAIPCGFSITEIVWMYDILLGKIVIDDLKPRYQDKFIYDTDYNLKLITKEQPTGMLLPEKKFLEFAYMSEYGNKYGQAVYQKVYWYWFFKKHSTKFWAIFTERFASPIVKVKMPKNANLADLEAIESFMANIKSATGVKVPEEFVVDLLEAERTGSVDSYEKFLEFLNRGMSIAILGQTLTSSAEQSGSLAMAKVHNMVRQDILKSDITFVENLFNDYLIPWLVDYNFPKVTEYPKWEIVLDDEIDTLQLAQVVEKLVAAGYNKIPINWIAKTFNIPLPEAGEEVLVKSAQVTFSEARMKLEADAYNEAMKKL
jgi:phage gp29-like protein